MHDPRFSCRFLLLVALACSYATSAFAAPIIDQSSGAVGEITSQLFTDLPGFSTKTFDDFALGAQYSLTTLTVFGSEFGNSALNTAVTATITSTADFSAVPILSVSGTQVGADLIFDFGGALLGPGSFFLTAFVTRPFSGGGQWFFETRLPVTGSSAVFHNPGGSFGFGTSPIPIASVTGTPRDLRFILEGELAAVPVPEPATLSLLGLGLAGVGVRRRMTRG